MKITDIDSRLNEGFTDAIKGMINRSGLSGEANKRSSNTQRQQEIAFKSGLQTFGSELKTALDSAVDSGLVSTSVQAAPQTQQTQQAAQPVQQAQSVDLDQLKAQSQASKLKGQADQRAAIQQMNQTKNANASTEDAKLAAAVKAAKAKPGFQQTAADKLAIKQGAAKGINEGIMDDFASLDTLLENTINQADSEQSVAEFVVRFMNQQAAHQKLRFSGAYEQALKKQAAAFQEEYIKNNGKVNDKLYGNLWKLFWSLNSTGGDNQRSQEQTQQPSNSPAATQQRSEWHDKMVKTLNAIDFNNPESNEQLKTFIKTLSSYVKQ